MPRNERDILKLIYDIKTSKGKEKKVTRKILKMDENNQYGNVMTKPLLYGCIKKSKKIYFLLEFNIILNSLSHEDKTGNLFTVDNKFS